MKILKRGLSAIVALIMILVSLPALSAGGVSTMATVANPTFSFAHRRTEAGVDEVEITITGPAGAEIYYTIQDSKADGTPSAPSNPTNKSNKYEAPFRHSGNTGFTIKAVAYVSGSASKVSTAQKPAYLATLSSSIVKDKDGKVIAKDIHVNLDAYKSLKGYKNIALRYTLDGTKPTKNSPILPTTTPYLRVSTTKMLSVSAVCDNYNVCSEPHTSKIQSDEWPEIAPKLRFTGRAIYGGWEVSIALNPDEDESGNIPEYEGVVINYATRTSASYADTDIYSVNTNVYTGPVTLTTKGRNYLGAYASGENYAPGFKATASVDVGECSKPTITVGNASNGRKKVTLTTSETKSGNYSPEIYYTIDGTNPTPTGGIRYEGEFYIGENCTVRAIVARKGSISSSVASQQITASGGTVMVEDLAVDIARVDAVNGTRSIYLSTKMPNAQIYYDYKQFSENDDATAEALKMDVGKNRLYDGPIVLDANKVGKEKYYAVCAVAYFNDMHGVVRRATTTIDEIQLSDYLETLPSGVRTVTFKPVSGADIYCVVNSGTTSGTKNIPIDEEHRYIYPLTIAQPSTVSTVVRDSAGNKSEVVSFGVNITDPSAKPEALPPVTVNYVSGGLTLDCADASADIFYILDNSADTKATPTMERYARGSTISAADKAYIHAAAMRPGYETSYVTQPAVSSNITPTPTITVIGPTNNEYAVSFTGSGSGAVYYYTTDGSEPSESSLSGSFATGLRRGQVVKAMAVVAGKTPSDVAAKIIGEETGVCGDVSITSEGSYGGIEVKLSTITQGAYIYYTTDGSEPSPKNGSLYNGSGVLLNRGGEITLKAIATFPGFENSGVSSKSFKLTKLQKVVIGKTGNILELKRANGEVDGVSFFYTLDGSDPDEHSQVCADGGQITLDNSVTRNVTIKIITVKKSEIYDDDGNVIEGYAPSDISERIFQVGPSPERPHKDKTEFVLGGELVYFSCPTEDAEIYYTTDPNGKPDILYTDPVLVTDRYGVKVKSSKEGMFDSVVVLYNANDLEISERPTANIENGFAGDGLEIELSGGKYVNPNTNKTEEYTIFYTTDGSEPTLDSEVYTGPITITGETTVKAAAAGVGHVLSPTAVFHYSAEEPTAVITPHLSREAGFVSGTVEVDASGMAAADGKAYIALYSGDEMLKAISCDFAENMTFGDIDVKADGGLIIKLFVLDENLTPQCRAEITVANI